MATARDRLEELETSHGMMQDELAKLRFAMEEKYRFMEESFGKLMEAVTSLREGGVHESSSGNHRRNEEPSNTLNRIVNNHNLAHQPNRFVKLEFPRFSGGDPTSWISKAKQYFSYQETPMEQRVSFASYHFEDEANEWWQATSKALREEAVPITWTVFEEELWARFGPTGAEDFDEALSKIKQTRSLRDYHREFERLQNKVNGWTQKALIGTYMGGLKDSISDTIRMFKPTTLKAAIEYARMRDDQLQRSRRHNTFSTARVAAPPTTTETKTLVPNSASSGIPKKLSWEEMRTKRSLGLCFSCDERYTPGHRCRKPQLLLMEGGDDEEEFEEATEELPEPEITIHALTGWGSPKTIRIQARVNQQQMTALIDSGSTHNFISERAANRLNLKITPIKTFKVRVADGYPLQCRGSYQQVAVDLGGVSFVVDLYALPLTGLDMVLGIQWLEQLGPTVCDWKAKTMKFMWAGQERKLCGLQTTQIQQAQAKEVYREVKMGQSCFALCIQEENVTVSPIAEDLRLLLRDFDEIFQTPTQLPPEREIEHHIVLKEGTNPVNVRPYRYAHFQKEEIER